MDRPKLWIQASARGRETMGAQRVRAVQPLSAGYKYLACVGIVMFWLHLFGWLGPAGQAGIEQGFMWFALLQVPMGWRWIRLQMNRSVDE